MRAGSSRPMVALALNIAPHYRKGILDQLLTSDAYEFKIFAGSRDPFNPDIPTITCWPEGRFCLSDLRMLGWRIGRTHPKNSGLACGVWQRGMIKLALNRKYRAIIYTGDAHMLSTWVGSVIARATGKKVIFWTIGWMRLESGPKAFLRDTFYRLANAYLFYGRHGQELAVEKGFPSENCSVVLNSLNIDALVAARQSVNDHVGCNLRKSLFDDSNIPVCICVARLIRRRRLDLLVEALWILSNRGIGMACLLVGEGSERQNLQALSKRLGVCAAFVGECYDSDVLAKYYAASAVSVSPGFVGLTCIQSLAFGVPVVTHSDPWQQCPEYEAIMPGETGSLFQRGSAEDLADVLQQYACSPRPSPEVQEKCLRSIQDKYTPANQKRIIEQLLSAIGVE